jgi:hypothetical protein
MTAKSIYSVGFVFILCLILQTVSIARILFQDDFEDDAIGKAPKKWVYEPSGEIKDVGFVDKDPLNPNNKVFTHYGRYLVGEETFKDYVAEWDWMFAEDNNRNNQMVFRHKDPGNYYVVGRASGGQVFYFYSYLGAWNLFSEVNFPTKIDFWYRARLILEGNKFSFWLKEKTDDTPFEKLKIIMDGSDNTLKEGKFGTDFWGPVDNVIIAEKAADILTVKPMGKLAFSWGAIKRNSESD